MDLEIGFYPNMDLLCPNCESCLTPSSVGYLCVGCGAVHKFYRTPDGTPIGPDIRRRSYNSEAMENPSQPPNVTSQSYQPIVNHTDSIQYKRHLRTRLKQMVVPELPSSIDNMELKQVDRPLLKQVDKPLLNPVPDSNVFQPAISNHAGESKTIENPSQFQAPKQKKSSLIKITLIAGLIVLLLVVSLVVIGLIGRRNNAAHQSTSTPSASSSKPNDAIVTTSTGVIDRDKQRKRDLKEISTALEVYKQDSGSYPIGSDISAVYPLQFTNPPYIKFVSNDPLSTESANIKYSYSSDGKTFTLKAKIENPQDNEIKDGFYTVNGY